MTIPEAVRRLRTVRRMEARLSWDHFDAEQQFGQDSPEERRALERATDATVEADWLMDELLDARS